jgi:hypothetical protein
VYLFGLSRLAPVIHPSPASKSVAESITSEDLRWRDANYYGVFPFGRKKLFRRQMSEPFSAPKPTNVGS